MYIETYIAILRAFDKSNQKQTNFISHKRIQIFYEKKIKSAQRPFFAYVLREIGKINIKELL